MLCPVVEGKELGEQLEPYFGCPGLVSLHHLESLLLQSIHLHPTV